MRAIREGDVPTALDLLLEAELANPRDADVHARLAYCHALVEQHSEATKCAERACIFGPDHTPTLPLVPVQLN